MGGHCIGVDPYYLTYKAQELGYHSKVITAGRTINDSVHNNIAREIVQFLIDRDKSLQQTRILIMGVTFKENVSDIRNSKVPELISELKEFRVKVDAIDPKADPEEFEHEYGIAIRQKPDSGYDAVVIAVNHKEYVALSENDLLSLANEKALIYDVKGVFRGRINKMIYKSL